jgi:Leucine-rich repeat (LRR) protein
LPSENKDLYNSKSTTTLYRHVEAVKDNLPPQEKAALYDLYEATDGVNWDWLITRGIWNFTDGSNPCDSPHWDGVICNQPAVPGKPRHVIELNLEGYRLRGTLPASIANLTNLESLTLVNNRISGTIPASLGNLHDLQYLGLAINNLTGTLPVTLVNLNQLSNLNVHTNVLNGTVPAFIGNMTSLVTLNLFRNELSGTLPASFGNLTNLLALEINSNNIEGTIPPSLSRLANLYWLYLYDNQLTGTIPPELCGLSRIRNFVVRNNFLTGTIADCVDSWWNATYFDVGNNYLHGSLPASLGNLTQLRILWAHNNSLSGSLPASLGDMAGLRELYLLSNRLTGTLPPQLGNLVNLAYLYLEDNLLGGTIPPQLSNASLSLLYLQNNLLTGTIPPALFRVQGLKEAFLQGNHLHGNLDGLFNSTQLLRRFQILQVSDNQLTGTLPKDLFRLPSLTTFVASKNCLAGTLSESICVARGLSTLILDGLKSAPACRQNLFLATHSYQVVGNDHGTIPSCLFHMPRLATLHLSGNGLTGTLPELPAASVHLVDLSLSHNALTGTIPSSLQLRHWDNLDLSFNRLTGELQADFGEYANGAPYELGNDTFNSTGVTFALQNNRLSGSVPAALVTFPNVSMLGSNLFSCEVDKSDLPQHDNDLASYECASDAFDYSYYAFVGVLTLCVAAGLCVMYSPQAVAKLPYVTTALECLRTWSLTQESVASMRHFRYVLALSDVLCQIGLGCTALIVLVLLPWYVAASQYFGTYTRQYGWTASAAFLSGATPTAVCLCLYVACIVSVAASSVYLVLRRDVQLQRTSAHLSVRHSEGSVHKRDPHMAPPLRRVAFYTAFVMVNLCAVVGMNAAFLAVALTQSNGVLFIAQILLSLFKLLWNTVCTPQLIKMTANRVSKAYHNAGFVTVQVVVALFNNIAIPCLVVAVVSPSCFTSVFSPPPEVTSSFVYEITVRPGINLVDQSFYKVTQYISYSPPFTYSYQCSSSLITYYAPAFVYLAITASMVIPVVKALGLYWYIRATPGTWWYRLLNYAVPVILKPVSDMRGVAGAAAVEAPALDARTYFDMNTFVVSLITYLGILLTFGVVFPPLAVAMCVTMLSVAWQGKLAVGRFLYNARATGAITLIDMFEKQCKGAASLLKLRRSLFTIICFACSFYALFLFDALGNDVGLYNAIWVIVVVPLLPLMLYAVACLRLVSAQRYGKGESVGFSLDDKVFEMRVRGGSDGPAYGTRFQQAEVTHNVLTASLATGDTGQQRRSQMDENVDQVDQL